MFPDFDTGVVTDQILRMREEAAEVFEASTFDLRGFLVQGFFGVDESPDTTVVVVPARVTHGVLSVADDGAAEVRNIE